MAASTLDELLTQMDDSWAWRAIELSAIRSQIDSLSTSDAEKPLGRALLRAGVALLYAHWEGYTKEVCQSYVDFVAKRKLKVSELSEPWVRMILLDLAVRARTDPNAQDSLYRLTQTGPSFVLRVPSKRAVNTQSNLRHATLMNIFDSIGLNPIAFSTRQPLIDLALCDERNAIAHGRASFPTPAAFLELSDEVKQMMEAVKAAVSNAAVMSHYKASSE